MDRAQEPSTEELMSFLKQEAALCRRQRVQAGFFRRAATLSGEGKTSQEPSRFRGERAWIEVVDAKIVVSISELAYITIDIGYN